MTVYRGVQLIWGNLTPKNTLYSDNHGLFHIVIQAKKDLSLNFIDRTREWHNGLFFDQKCMWNYELTTIFWLNIVKLSQNGRQTTNIWYIRIVISSKPGQSAATPRLFWGPRSQSRAPPPPQPLEHSCKSTGPKKKKIKIPPRWPFRISQFLNGHRGGFSFFSIFRSGGLQECSPSQ